MKTELIESIKDLYNDIDNCISDLLKARLQHDMDLEGKSLNKMESLMVEMMQEFDCILDYLKENE